MVLTQTTSCFAVDSCSFGHLIFQDWAFTVLEKPELQFSGRLSFTEVVRLRRGKMSPLLAGSLYLWLKGIQPTLALATSASFRTSYKSFTNILMTKFHTGSELLLYPPVGDFDTARLRKSCSVLHQDKTDLHFSSHFMDCFKLLFSYHWFQFSVRVRSIRSMRPAGTSCARQI